MKKTIFILFALIGVLIDSNAQIKQINKISINGNKGHLFFYDHLVALAQKTDLNNLPDSVFLKKFDDIQFTTPTYIVELKIKKTKLYRYYILRANKSKQNTPFFFDLDIVQSSIKLNIDTLKNQVDYKFQLLKTIDAKGCRGATIYEHNDIAQKNPSLIGNGIQLVKGVFVRVIPFNEIQTNFYKLIENNIE